MSVGNVGSNTYPYGGASQLAPAGAPAISNTLANAPQSPAVVPVASSNYSLVTARDGSTHALMQAPANYQNSYNFPIEGNPSGLLGATGTGQGKHTASKVFWATIAVYGTFLAGVAAVLTMPALSRFRGVAPKLTFGTRENTAEIQSRKAASWSKDTQSFNQLVTNQSHRESVESHFGLNHRYKNDKERLAAFVSTDKNIIEHNGWWEKTHYTDEHGAKHDVYVGYHAKGAHPSGSLENGQKLPEVKTENGELRVAYMHPSIDYASHDTVPAVHRLASKSKAAPVASDEKIVVIDPRFGRQLLNVEKIKTTKDFAANLKELKNRKINVDLLKEQLLSKKRIPSQANIFEPSTWEAQYERGRGTRGVDSSKPVRQLGQIEKRLREFVGGTAESFQNPRDGGNRMGLMLISSTMLNAMLAATAAAVALTWTSAPSPKGSPLVSEGGANSTQ